MYGRLPKGPTASAIVAAGLGGGQAPLVGTMRKNVETQEKILKQVEYESARRMKICLG